MASVLVACMSSLLYLRPPSTDPRLCGTSVDLHGGKLVPLHDMFCQFDPNGSDNLRCSIFEQGDQPRSCNNTPPQASSDVSARILFFRWRVQPASILQPFSSAGHNRASEGSYCHPPRAPGRKSGFQSRHRETLSPYRTDERSARIPSTPSDRQRSRGRQ